MLCLLICRRVFGILHLCIGHLPCDRHCSRGWGLRGKRWSSQLISSKKGYGAHRSGTQCRSGQEGLGCRSCWRLLPKVSGVLAECWRIWRHWPGEGGDENVPGRTIGTWALRPVFLKVGAIGSLRGQMFFYETLPCTGGCWASLPLGTKCQQYLLTAPPQIHNQYNSQKCPFTFPNAEPPPPLHQGGWCHCLGENHCWKIYMVACLRNQSMTGEHRKWGKNEEGIGQIISGLMCHLQEFTF